MTELTLGQILSRAQEIVRSASSPYEYEQTQQFLNDAKPFGREAFDAAIQLLDGDLDEKILGCDLLSTLLNPDNNAWGHEAAAALVHISDDASDDDLCIFVTRALGLSNDPL
jgi:hypothetical protein